MALHAQAAAREEGRPHTRYLRQADDVRWRRFGIAALVTAVLPVTLGAEGGLFLWDLLPVADVADALQLLAPVLLGLALVSLSFAPRLTRLGQGLCGVTMLLIGTAGYTASPVAWEQAFEGLLAFVGRRPLLVTLGLSLLAAGGSLRLGAGEPTVGPTTNRLARALLIGGSALVVIVYVLPQRGAPFAYLLAERIVWTTIHGGAAVAAGRVLYWTLGLLPLGLAAGALLSVIRRWRPTILLGLGARYGLSVLTVLLCIPLLVGAQSPHGALLQVRTAVLLAVAIGSVSQAVEQVTRHLLDTPLPPTQPRSMLCRDVALRHLVRAAVAADGRADRDLLETPPATALHPWLRWLMRRRLADLAEELGRPRRDLTRPGPRVAQQILAVLEARFEDVEHEHEHEHVADQPPWPGSWALWMLTGRRRLPLMLAAGALVAVGVLGGLLCEPEPDLTWSLQDPTPQADALFAEHLPRYVVALGRRSDERTQGRAGAEAGLLLRRQTTELQQAARAVNRSLDEPVNRLVRAADAVDRTGRLWLDAVQRINQSTRGLGLPYYVDGNVLQITSRTDGTVRQLFYVTTYRVQRLRRFATGGRRYASLHVRRLDRLNIAGSRLGTVRPDEPFALVLLDNVERSVDERLTALRESDRCAMTSGSWGGLLPGATSTAEMESLCARTIGQLARGRGIALDADDDRARHAFVALQIDATERHELQHQVDGPRLEVPIDLYKLAPQAEDRSLRRVAHELSAHLAELNTDDSLATAWRLADLTALLVRRQGGATYRYAAAVILGRLAGRPVMSRDGRVALDEVVRLWERAADQSEQLAGWVAPAVQQAHEELFGEPMARLRPEGD